MMDRAVERRATSRRLWRHAGALAVAALSCGVLLGGLSAWFLGSVAIASFSSGGLLSHGGWETVNWLVFPPVAVALLLVLWQRTQRRAAA